MRSPNKIDNFSETLTFEDKTLKLSRRVWVISKLRLIKKYMHTIQF